MPHPTNPAGLRIIAVALTVAGAVIGIVMPAVLALLGISTMEIAPGIDLMTVLLPAVGIVDWIMAYSFWRRAGDPGSPAGGGPIVG